MAQDARSLAVLFALCGMLGGCPVAVDDRYALEPPTDSSGGPAASSGCSDGVENGSESDVDCGGAECAACEPEKRCRIARDCRSWRCADSLCQPQDCGDNAQNGTETGIDCGGPECLHCAAGEPCISGADCNSGNCASGICT